MLVTGSIREIRSAVRLWKRQKLRVGFVPTMGALHEGHLSLIRRARKISDRVVVSIYVNPQQFAPGEDYQEYPRTMKADLKLLQKLRVAALFTPEDEMMYPSPPIFQIGINTLHEEMCGASRPGFFQGVVLVVNKFFNIVEPDVAVFGQKDFQQFRILSEMVREFNHPVEMVMSPTERANDGLALSSRNAYLSNEERFLAPSLYQSLHFVEKMIRDGAKEPGTVIEHQKSELQAKGFKIDYLDVFSQSSLKPVERCRSGESYVIAGAVILGKTRLIDNILIDL